MGKIAQDNQAIQSGRIYTCRIRTLLTELDDDDFNVVQSRLADKRLSHRAVSRWLGSFDLQASEGSVYKHRNERCTCFRAMDVAS